MKSAMRCDSTSRRLGKCRNDQQAAGSLLLGGHDRTRGRRGRENARFRTDWLERQSREGHVRGEKRRCVSFFFSRPLSSIAKENRQKGDREVGAAEGERKANGGECAKERRWREDAKGRCRREEGGRREEERMQCTSRWGGGKERRIRGGQNNNNGEGKRERLTRPERYQKGKRRGHTLCWGGRKEGGEGGGRESAPANRRAPKPLSKKGKKTEVRQKEQKRLTGAVKRNSPD